MLVTEVKHHLNKPTETYRCRVLVREPAHLVVSYRTDRDWHVAGIAIPAGSATIAHYWPHRPYVLWHMLGPDRALLGHLVHICTPPRISADTIEYSDLILDIWFRPEGTHQLLDADELAQAGAAGRLTDADAARIEADARAVIAEWPHLLAESSPSAELINRAFAPGDPPAVIGGVVVDPPLVLAPMAGVTNSAFRQLCRAGGAGLVCSEMVSALALVQGNRRSRQLLAFTAAERPLSIQLFGNAPEPMAEAARVVAAAGPDLIDINMGCSVPKVTGSGAGAALLGDLDHAQRIVRAVARAVSLPVTVKMRSRWRGSQAVAVEMAQRAEDAGAAGVAIHPVPGKGERLLDWRLIAQAKRAVSIPVIGNGGVRTPDDAARLFAETGCDAVMIGRAALGNPWIFGQIAHYLGSGGILPPPDLQERLVVASRHGRLLIEQRGEARAVREMRKHLGWYLRGFRGAARLRDQIGRLGSWGDLQALLDSLAPLAPAANSDYAIEERRPA